jgi:predicted nucleotidyltransferase
MELTTYFNDFLRNIRLTQRQIEELRKGHETLRSRLHDDEVLSKIIVSTFLQGSYRRATAIIPNGDQRSDIDVVVVTKMDKDEYSPDQALKSFIPFMEKHYKGK